jgi:DNA-binding IclR family transcriptional regulator
VLWLSRHELADLTPHTVTDLRVLRRLLVGDPVDHQSGLAVDSAEYHLGVTCLSAAVRTADRAAAVPVSAPLARQQTLVESADVVERQPRRGGRRLDVVRQ